MLFRTVCFQHTRHNTSKSKQRILPCGSSGISFSSCCTYMLHWSTPWEAWIVIAREWALEEILERNFALPCHLAPCAQGNSSCLIYTWISVDSVYTTLSLRMNIYPFLLQVWNWRLILVIITPFDAVMELTVDRLAYITPLTLSLLKLFALEFIAFISPCYDGGEGAGRPWKK